MSEDLPGAVLFACTQNQIRSPMAEAMLKYLHGHRIFVQSVGLRADGEADGFAIAVLDEVGIDMSAHRVKSFEDLTDNYFDVVISLSPEAQHRAVELTRYSAFEMEFWHMPDPSVAHYLGREDRLQHYRELRDRLMIRIQNRFPTPGGPKW